MSVREKIQKHKGWLIPSSLLFILAVLITIWVVIPSFLVKKMTEYAREKSGGEYTFLIEDIRRGIFPLSVTFSGVSLEPVGNENADEGGNLIQYSFSAGKIAMNGIHLRDL